MNRSVRSAAAVFILSLMAFACGGGGHGGGGTSPTEPSGPTGKRFQFSAIAAPGNFEGNILEAAVFFDGREVGRTDWTRTGGSCFFPCEVVGDVQGVVAPGDHTVRFTVVRQQRASTLYEIILSGFITDPVTGRRDQVGPTSQRVRLRAGESVSFTVRF